MVRTVFVNGDYLPEAEGKISIFDRGFLFADGVYEVSPSSTANWSTTTRTWSGLTGR